MVLKGVGLDGTMSSLGPLTVTLAKTSVYSSWEMLWTFVLLLVSFFLIFYNINLFILIGG